MYVCVLNIVLNKIYYLHYFILFIANINFTILLFRVKTVEYDKCGINLNATSCVKHLLIYFCLGGEKLFYVYILLLLYVFSCLSETLIHHSLDGNKFSLFYISKNSSSSSIVTTSYFLVSSLLFRISNRTSADLLSISSFPSSSVSVSS